MIGGFAAILLVLSLGFAACAHDEAVERRDAGAMLNDSPAISPWSGPVPSEPLQDDGSYARGPGDEN